MKALTTFVALKQITSAFLNAFQNTVFGHLAASEGGELDPTGKAIGIDGRTYISPGTVADNGTAVMDKSIDWTDRWVSGTLTVLAAASARPGQSTDYAAPSAAYAFGNYVGNGGYGTTSGAPVDSTNAPTQGAGTVRSYAISISGGVYWVFVDPTSKALCVYNNSGSAAQFVVTAHGTGKLGKR